MDEKRFKIIAINALLKEMPQCLALEVPFVEGARRADIVSLTAAREIAGYEIKSERDNLDSLEAQLLDYAKVFELTYVILAKKHLPQARSMIPNSVGIFVINVNGDLTKSRKATKRVRFKKTHIIASIDKYRIDRALKNKNIKAKNDSDKYKLIEKKFSMVELKEILYSQFYEKYAHSFKTFQSEIGNVIHTEDLLNFGIERRLR